MCCTLANARLSNTILYAAEVCPDGGEAVHVLGYQNRVQNLPPGRGPTGNAMILPFPAVPGTMTQKNVLATEDCPKILEDLADCVRHQNPGIPRSLSAAIAPKNVLVFETGIYTVVLARDPRAIPAALKRVPSDKRPALNPPIFDAYAAWYPGWTIALCCFNNTEATQATPMLWWYRPANPEELFAPALDCHSGAVSDLEARVHVDHAVAVSSYLLDREGFWKNAPNYRNQNAQVWDAMEQLTRVRYRDAVPPTVRPFLCDHALGSAFEKKMRNGDFVCSVKTVRDGAYQSKNLLRRVGPPGARNSVGA